MEFAQEAPMTMTAIVMDRYGAPEETFQLRDINRPTVGDAEVLVKVHAAPVSGTDWHLYRGLPYVARFVTGLRKPKSRVPGFDLAGTVEAVGKDVVTFQPGDEVFGWCGGSFAGYASGPEKQFVRKPANLTLEQAAVVPIAALTALQGVRDKGKVQSGQKVLITGASGGVGTYAVQFAKWLGAEVTAMCSAAKVDLVRSLGADHVIDYSNEDMTARGESYDVLIDIYGNPSLLNCRRALKPMGTLVFIGGTGGNWFMGVDRWLRGLLLAPFLRVKVRPLIHKDSYEDLVTIKDLIEEGIVGPILEKKYPLADAAKAIQYVTEGHAKGQVAVVCGE